LTRVYRILRRTYSSKPFDGEGAYRFGGRWSSPGTRIAYTSEHVSLAILEYFVHIDPDDPPRDLVLAVAEIPDSVTRVKMTVIQLPANWRETPADPKLTAIGDEFVRNGRATILIVPSALAPGESNWLINPLHSGFSKIKLKRAETFQYDSRLFRPR
jgi:RES domain-containing protein